jgi:hypothetical protein
MVISTITKDGKSVFLKNYLMYIDSSVQGNEDGGNGLISSPTTFCKQFQENTKSYFLAAQLSVYL